MSTPENNHEETPVDETVQDGVQEGVVPYTIDMQAQVESEVEKQQKERDLTGERDARVIPLVKYLIGVIGSTTFEFNRDGSKEASAKEKEIWQGIMDTHFVPKAIENKLQLTDINYLFQLMQTTIALVRERSKLPKDPADPRFTDAALTILKLLGNQETLDLNFNTDVDAKDGIDRAALYDGFYLNIVEPTFKLYNIEYNETAYVFEVIDKIIRYFSTVVNDDLDMLRDVADNKLYGVPMTELDVHTLMLKASQKTVE